MKILEIKVLKGPNYWSIRRAKLIQMKLGPGRNGTTPTNKDPWLQGKTGKNVSLIV